MSTFTLTIGLVIREGLRTWRLDRTLDDSRLVFLDLENGAPKTLSVAELQRDVLARRLQIVQEHPVALAKQSAGDIQLVTTIQSLPVQEQARLRLRLAYVKHMLRRGIRKGMRSQVDAALADLNDQLPAGAVVRKADSGTDAAVDGFHRTPSPSAVMTWMRTFELSGGNPLSLISRHNIRQSPRRILALVEEVARRRIREHYCSRKRPTARQTKLLINQELEQHAARGRIEPECAQISTSTLRRLIEEISPYDRCSARYGVAYARNRWSYSLGGVDAPRVLARYEIDHTIVDIVVVHDLTGLPLGRPTITVVVDAFSGYIASFFISFWSPGLATALAAFKLAIRPKDLLTGHAELRHRWLALGIPDLMVVDNGLEFHSRHFHAAAMHLAIDVLHCAVRQPWLKPMVERTIGTLTGFLPDAGRVEKRLTNYIPERPEKSACITFGALCMGLLKTVVDAHPFEINERRLDRAYDLYGEGLSRQLAPRLPSSLEELDIIMATGKELTIGNEGVVYNYLRYNSRELQDIRRRVGLKFRTAIKINPEDIHHIWVQDPSCGSWLKVPSCMPQYTDGLSLVQHKAIRELKKKELTLRGAEETLTRGRLEVTEVWSGAFRHGKRLKTQTLKSLSGMTSNFAWNGSSKAIEMDSRPQPEPLMKEELLPLPKELETYAFD